MFGKVDFKVDGIKMRKNERKLCWGCLVREGRGKRDGGAQVFSAWAHQKVFSSKWGENWGEKIPICTWLIPSKWLFFFSFFIQLLCLPIFFFIYLHVHNFFAKKMCYFFVLFEEDIIINLYQFHFSSSHFSSQPNK